MSATTDWTTGERYFGVRFLSDNLGCVHLQGGGSNVGEAIHRHVMKKSAFAKHRKVDLVSFPVTSPSRPPPPPQSFPDTCPVTAPRPRLVWNQLFFFLIFHLVSPTLALH